MAREGEEKLTISWDRVNNPDVPDNPDNDYYTGEVASHKLDIKPQSLTTAATTLSGKVTTLSDTIKRISETWNGLSLGWVGQTQKEADEFNTRFQAAYRAMFGDDKTPTKVDEIKAGECALGKISALTNAAAKTYANAEDGLTGRFYQFGQQLAGTYNSSEWTDPNKPSEVKHPTYQDHIPTLGGAIPASGTPSSTRNFTDAPIQETTPSK